MNGPEFAIDLKRTVKATTSEVLDEVWTETGYAVPGLCLIDKNNSFRDHLCFTCPGCGDFGSIRCTHPKDVGGKSWDITGGSLSDPTTLTLSPSIHCKGCCGWHGHLKAGVFESC